MLTYGIRIWSRETGSAVSASAFSFSTLGLNLVLNQGIPPAFRGDVHIIYRQPPLGESRVYRVSQLRTYRVPCRESAALEPAVLKVVGVTGAAFPGFNNGPIFYMPVFSPTHSSYAPDYSIGVEVRDTEKYRKRYCSSVTIVYSK